MKRELKFRAWDKKTREMFTTFDISSQGVAKLSLIGQDIKYFNEVVIMQYTGMYDKNNRDIYEFDIVQAHETTYKIIFANGSFGGIRGGRFCHINNMYSEVIGNVFENPELVPPYLSFSKT